MRGGAIAALAGLALCSCGSGSGAAGPVGRGQTPAPLGRPATSLRPGQFLYTRTMQVLRFPEPLPTPRGGSPELVGLTQRLTTETWLGADGTTRTRVDPVGVPTFASPADRARFAAAGLRPAAFSHAQDSTDAGHGAFPSAPFSMAELGRLPAHPQALYRRIVAALAAREHLLPSLPVPPGAVTKTFRISVPAAAADLGAIEGLFAAPVPAAVRSALPGAAELIPGARVNRHARDSLGRAGVGFTAAGLELIVDPASGALLGVDGAHTSDTATLATGVVDSIDALPPGVTAVAVPPRVPLGVTPASGPAGTTFTVSVGPVAGGSEAFTVLGPACHPTGLPQTVRSTTAYRIDSRGFCGGDYRVQVTAFGARSGALGTVRFRVGSSR